MCGVAAIAGRFDEGALGEMVGCQVHRGPDDRGVEQRDLPDGRRVGVGSNRLSILDPGPAGHMPMSDPEADVHLVHNGEVYNFVALRSELESQGHAFRTGTDTEVLLRLWLEEGEEMVDRLEGMFAFVVWDARRNRVFAARDRLGIKPLYWALDGRGLALASEIKALLRIGAGGGLDGDALWDYFTYLHIPDPQTAWEGIRQLLPGHRLSWDVATERLQIERWWSPLGSGARPEPPADLEPAAGELRERMSRSVRDRLISDVPLGVFLSGGVDSSVITGLMAEAGADPVRTFTVHFSGAGMEAWDERETARAVARRWDTEHHELEVDVEDPAEILDLVTCFDQPFANPTYYLQWLIARETREHVKVALSGAGGDELFAGYPRYRGARLGRWAGRLPGPLLHGARRLVGLWPDDHGSRALRRAKLFLDGLDDDFARQWARWVYYLDEEGKRRLLRRGRFPDPPDSVRLLREKLEVGDAAGLDWLGRLQYLDLTTFLPDNILTYTDRASMANSLEVRVPWLDHGLVEWSLALPARWKLRGRTTKRIVREAFGDLMPPETRRASKRGFVPPLARWMEGVLDRYFEERFTPDHVEEQGVFRREAVEEMRRWHARGDRDYSMELFGVLVFDAWWREYVA